MWWRLPASVAVLLLARYLSKLGTPRQDWWQVEEWYQQAMGWLRRRISGWRARFLANLGFTGYMWERMRRRYQAGAFGEQGT